MLIVAALFIRKVILERLASSADMYRSVSPNTAYMPYPGFISFISNKNRLRAALSRVFTSS